MGRKDAFLHFPCLLLRLNQLAGAEHRLQQPDEGNHFLEEEGKVQPRLPGATLSADRFSFLSWKLHLGGNVRTFGESGL